MGIETIIAFVIKQLISFIISQILSFILNAIFGKPEEPQDFDFKTGERLIRSPIAPHRILYGEKLLSGSLVFASSTDNDEKLHMVVVHSATEVEGFGDIYIGDERVPARNIDGSGNVTAGTFNGLVRVKFHDGNELQAADSALVSEVGNWTSSHKGGGWAYAYYRLTFDKDKFTGIPNLRTLTRGRKVWDPRDAAVATISFSAFVTAGFVEITTVAAHGRTAGDRVFIVGHSNDQIFGEYFVDAVTSSTTFEIVQDIDTLTGFGDGGSVYLMKYSFNPALCILDYLVNRQFGMAAKEREINVAQVTASANSCEEQVPLAESEDGFTADASSDVMTRSSSNFPINTGSTIKVKTDDTLPGGLAAETLYYYINMGTTADFKLATTFANAVSGTAINITDAGSGNHDLIRFSQPRYTCNGAFTVEAKPIEIIQNMLTSCAGSVANIQGQYNIFVAQQTAQSASINEDDLRAAMTIVAGPTRQEVFNIVQGVFISPDNFWQAADFPAVSRSIFRVEDGGEIRRSIEFRFTSDSTEAQRIATIHLLRSRAGVKVTFPGKLSLLPIQALDVVGIVNAAAGWSDKEFRVLEWKLVPDGRGLGLHLELQEEDPNAYTWDPNDAQFFNPPPDINVPPFFGDLSDRDDDVQNALSQGTDASCLIDGLRDQFVDQSGIDEGQSSNHIYDGTEESYSPDTGLDMSLVSSDLCPADEEAKQARIMLLVNPVDALTLNTDIVAGISRDGGGDFQEVILSKISDLDSPQTAGGGRVWYAGTANLTALPSGTDMRWRIESFNAKDFELHAVALTWR